MILCSTFFAREALPAAMWEGMAHASLDHMPAPLREAFVAAAPDPAAVPVRFAKQVALMTSCVDLPVEALRAIAGHGTYLGALDAAKAGSPLPAITVALVEAFLDGQR